MKGTIDSLELHTIDTIEMQFQKKSQNIFVHVAILCQRFSFLFCLLRLPHLFVKTFTCQVCAFQQKYFNNF